MRLLSDPRVAWIVLGAAMAASAALILHATAGQALDIDEFFYYGRMVDDAGRLVHFPSLSLEYLLAPYNGHLQLGGKLIYEALFALAGSEYRAFVLANVAALCASVALAFELARRSVGPLLALAPCILLLFLGFAREVLLWPFDLHTLVALACGLGALLALQREDRAGDVLACALLVASIATIEIGLAFLAGVAVSVAMRPDRWRRAWIIALPALLYAAWWLWARRFDQSETVLSNLPHLPQVFLDALAAVAGSLTGTNPILPSTYSTEVTGFGRALALAALFGLALRLRRGALPRGLWIWLAVLASYWTFLTIAARAPEGSRYLFVGAVGVLLVGAEALRGRASNRLAVLVAAVALVALPANVGQLLEGREGDTLHADAGKIQAEFAMIELARGRVSPDYVASNDPRVGALGGGLFIGMPAGTYLDGRDRNGSLAFTLPQLRRQPQKVRRIADAALVGALGLALEPASPSPGELAACAHQGGGPGAAGARGTAMLAPGTTLIRARGGNPVRVGLRRFAGAGPGVSLAHLRPGGWVSLEIPADAAPDAWWAVFGGPVTVCPA